MSKLDEIRTANQQYQQSFPWRHLDVPPSRNIAIVACMDARLNLYEAFGLKTGEAHLIRNAGGLATEDAIRSLIISYKLLGTREFFVVEHTGCGMLSFQNSDLQDKLTADTGTDASGFDFLPFSDLKASLRTQVDKIHSNPFIPKEIPVHGLIYHVESGNLEHVVSLGAKDQASELAGQIA